MYLLISYLCAVTVIILSVVTDNNAVVYHGQTFDCRCRNSRECVDYNGIHYTPGDVCPSGCETGWEGPGCQIGVNIAHSLGTARQWGPWSVISSSNNEASNCIDGNTNTDPAQGSCCAVRNSQTGGKWEVTFDGRYLTNSITIYVANEMDDNLNEAEIKLYYNNVRREIFTISLESGIYTAMNFKKNIDKIKVSKQSSSLAFCELTVRGHRYKNCERENGHYYHGPGCLLNCYCSEQCSRATGYCSSSHGCLSNYKHTSDGLCVPCTDGYWGEGCSEACHCKDTDEACDPSNGTCLSGCPDGYVDLDCNYRLPRFSSSGNVENDLQQNYRILGRQLSLEFQTDHVRKEDADLTALSYYILYNSDGEWTNDTVSRFTHTDNDVQVIKYRLPDLLQQYTVCVSTFDELHGVPGEISPCIDVYTDCTDGMYGDTCQNRCTCRDSQEVCNKRNGHCLACDDGYLDEACTIETPTEKDVVVHYSGKKNAIQVDIQLQPSYVFGIDRVMIVCVSDGSYVSASVGFNGSYSVDNLLSSTVYTCSSTPYITSESTNDIYKGLPIYVKQVQTASLQNPGNSTVAIASSVAVVVVLIIVVAVVITFLWKRRRKQFGKSHNVQDLQRDNLTVRNKTTTTSTLYENGCFPEEDEKEASVKVHYSNVITSHAISSKVFSKRLQQLSDIKGGFEEEFNKIPNPEALTSAGDDRVNAEKHRFNNIKAFDHSRVSLSMRDNIQGE